MNTYTWIYICISMYVYILIYTCVHMYVRITLHMMLPSANEQKTLHDMYIYIYIYVYAYIHVCVYSCVFSNLCHDLLVYATWLCVLAYIKKNQDDLSQLSCLEHIAYLHYMYTYTYICVHVNIYVHFEICDMTYWYICDMTVCAGLHKEE